MQPGLLNSYITRQIAKGNLTEWTIVLANVQDKGSKRAFSTKKELLTIGASVRGNNSGADSEFYIANNAAVSGPSYESLDLTDAEYQEALAKTIDEWKIAKEAGKTKRKTEPTSPFANCAKAVRKKTRGLLLLFNMDFGDTNTQVFSYVLSLPYLKEKDDIDVAYEYMGSPNAFKVIEDND